MPSEASGGLGFRKMGEMNKALVAKLAWQVYKESKKIWVQLIRSKYLRGRKLLDVESIPTRAS